MGKSFQRKRRMVLAKTRQRKTLITSQREAQQDLQSCPSPAALVPEEQTVTSNMSEKLFPVWPIDFGLPKAILKPSNGYSLPKLKSMNMKDNQENQLICEQTPIKYRPLKLVNDYAIVFAQMPVDSSFKILRDVVGKHYPMLKAVLIKYKDSDGDLMTITCSSDLRLAESLVDSNSNKTSKEPGFGEKRDSALGMLRLYVVRVNPEQEPPLLENEEEDEPECKEVEEMDDWLFDLVQNFRTHFEIDPDSHTDLHKVRMALYKALMETVASEESQTHFDKAASKFEEVAASAFFNLGNLHMCAAQKRMPIDLAAGPKEAMDAHLKNAYDSVREEFKKAKREYKKAILIKPGFYEGLLALGQQQFEMAMLHWWFVIVKKSDLSEWDLAKTFKLLDSAEKYMEAATKMWEKMEEQRANESKQDKKDKVSKKKQKVEVTPEEAAKQAEVMSSQIHLFWGNMLYARSQIESELGLSGSDKTFDAAVERFELAMALEPDIFCNEEDKAEEVIVCADVDEKWEDWEVLM